MTLYIAALNLAFMHAALALPIVPDIIPTLEMDDTGAIVTTMSFTVEFDIIEEQLVNGPIDK